MLLPIVTATLNILRYFIIFLVIAFGPLAVIFLVLRLLVEPITGICTSKAKLHGKIILITGGNTGLGLETARDLAKRGAKIIIASRDVKKSAAAVEDIINTTGNNDVEYLQLDLSRFSDVQKFAEYFNKNYDRLDILVNNAGCASFNGGPSEDGINVVMQINYFGHFLLTSLLLDKLVASRPSRIFNVASVLHRFGSVTEDNVDGLRNSNIWKSYCNSKLCQILWTKALAKRLPVGVTVNALHPGVVYTNIYKWAEVFEFVFKIYLNLFFKTPEEGAQTTIDVCVNEELENVSGKYFHDCKLTEPSTLATNDVLAEKIWYKSMELTNACYKTG